MSLSEEHRTLLLAEKIRSLLQNNSDLGVGDLRTGHHDDSFEFRISDEFLGGKNFTVNVKAD